ncbi:serine/threonine protein kinase [Ottowia testudinis]|uniref:Stress response kinase A n=1 Tax=Ottowia testudinis TaxID=2816950 RepID=A0A975CK42_9BURK|nr:serine/threonine protein kinase [Ottowia testudinis]QTD47301.1 serine/threonine protein kinase [Ottowia testudinis]
MPRMPSSPHPFETLTPDFVMDALASVGLVGDGRLMALNSYENRVYLAHLEPGTPLADAHPAVVLKFYRPGRWSAVQIEEEHAFAHELMAAEVPVVGPLVIGGRTLHEHGGFLFSVSPRRGGRMPEPGDMQTLEWIGRFLARLHTVGARRPFAQRPAVDVAHYGTEPRDWLLASGALPLEVEREWADLSQNAIDLIASGALSTTTRDQKDTETHAITTLRLHADCHPGNILWTPADLPGGGPHFVDLDDCRSGPAVQDVWMLLGGERAERQRQLGALLDGYEQMREFDRRELALIEPLRTLRLIHYSAWVARRWDDPAFPAGFPDFGTPDYWRGQVVTLRDQLEAMEEQPLVA